MPLSPPVVSGDWEFEPIDEPVHKYWPCIRASRDGQSSYVVSSARRALAIPGVAEIEAIASNLHSSIDHSVLVNLSPTFPNGSASVKGWSVKANELAALDADGEFKWASACIKQSSTTTTLSYVLCDKGLLTTHYVQGLGPQAGHEYIVSPPASLASKHSFLSLSMSEMPNTDLFVITYGSKYSAHGYVPDIHMSVIDSNGHEVLSSFPVSYLTQGNVAPLSADTFPRVTSFVFLKTTYIAVAWNRIRQDGSHSVVARVFDNKAMPVALEAVVISNNATVGAFSRPSIASIDEIGFAVTWNAVSDTKLVAYFAIYAPNGQPIIPPTGISRTNAGAMLAPFIAACRWVKGGGTAPSNYYVITWQQVVATDIIPKCAVFRHSGSALNKVIELSLEDAPGPALSCADNNEYVRTELFSDFGDHLVAGFVWSRLVQIAGGATRVEVRKKFITIA